MEVSAKVSFVRVTPRKIGMMARELRGKDINEALKTLVMSPKKRIAGVFSTLLKSAVSNADRKGTIDVDTLFVKSLLVGRGPTLKRFRPRAKGSASPILKRTSHIRVTLAER